jgi:hypothetical protein
VKNKVTVYGQSIGSRRRRRRKTLACQAKENNLILDIDKKLGFYFIY